MLVFYAEESPHASAADFRESNGEGCDCRVLELERNDSGRTSHRDRDGRGGGGKMVDYGVLKERLYDIMSRGSGE